jgi:hypothetical protein
MQVYLTLYKDEDDLIVTRVDELVADLKVRNTFKSQD